MRLFARENRSNKLRKRDSCLYVILLTRIVDGFVGGNRCGSHAKTKRVAGLCGSFMQTWVTGLRGLQGKTCSRWRKEMNQQALHGGTTRTSTCVQGTRACNVKRRDS